MSLLVIGATNIDIIGVSQAKLISRESNIGEVSVSIGGVAKNIAEDLRYLGEDVSFVTYVGNDVFTHLLCKHLDDLEISYPKALFSENKNNVYLAVHDFDGDMSFGLNDLNNFNLLDEEYFKSIHEYIDQFDKLILDCNLSEKSLKYLVEKFKHKFICVEGVSQTKVIKIRNMLKHIDLLKINDLELNALLNMNNCDIIKGVRYLLELGVKNVVVSSGNQPITYNVGEYVYQTDVMKTDKIKSTVGAGDALFSGVIKYLNHSQDMHQAVNFAKKVAAITLESESACNKDISNLKDL